ncbi:MULTISPECIES: helix-turn-helix transcriptional regulator [Enterobacteriaceae]|jgi:transcriptional regulator with XRE-family HTH domain|uniref:helix-turn-helix transcriptional regulator n=1 Tax=Enterobacteriaceae TaxID=543 RepID=UPI00142C9998|nr:MULTISPECIES: helix-turn-helix transcriptional regulator [Enterobacteriaceae]ECW0140336.1 helix-turn-helix transcriptional regulator [Salmonella enterica subsp. salamae]MCU3443889.1 helix-turn-helix domain-containing protein [Enterobacter asburiae]HCU0179702.1 helix-turn-helix transcriptional regulator [Enterobacter hormaechei]
MTSSTLASRIKERRKALGITQTSLAESVGMRQQSIQYLESGRATRTSFILELAKVLKCDPDWLLNGENLEQQKA